MAPCVGCLMHGPLARGYPAATAASSDLNATVAARSRAVSRSTVDCIPLCATPTMGRDCAASTAAWFVCALPAAHPSDVTTTAPTRYVIQIAFRIEPPLRLKDHHTLTSRRYPARVPGPTAVPRRGRSMR